MLDRARTAFGDVPELLLLDARRLLRRGSFADADERLLALTDRDDDIARAAFSWLAASRLAAGDPTNALDSAEKAFRLDKNDAVATYIVAMALADTNDPRAAAWLERARALAPRNPLLGATIARLKEAPMVQRR